jgi:hypothetical protein
VSQTLTSLVLIFIILTIFGVRALGILRGRAIKQAGA